MADVEAVELCEWPGGCTNRKAPAAPTGGNPPRYCEHEVEGERHDARERYRKFGRKSERALPAALPDAGPAEGLRAEMDRTQLAAEALLDALAHHGDAEAIEERIGVIEREAAARVQAAEAKATQALAENDQRLAAMKREVTAAEAARDEARAEAAAARDANAQLEGEVVPRLEGRVTALEQQLESERAAHRQALTEQAAQAAAELDATRTKADARVAAANEETKRAKDAARSAEKAAADAKASTQAAEAVAAEQRRELARLRDDHAAELERVRRQAEARLAERVDSLTAAHVAQLEARDARIGAAEQLATERAGERDRLQAEVALLGEQIRALNVAAAPRQAAEEAPARVSRRRAERPPAGE